MRTPEERTALAACLESKGGFWVGTRDYETLTPKRLFGQLDDLCDAITAVTDSDPGAVRDAYEASCRFVEAGFRAYRRPAGKAFDRPVDSVFAVPLRADGRSDIFSTDTDAFFPIFSREFGVTPSIQLRAVLGLPPCIIETNQQGSSTGESGITIFVPLFSSMVEDISNPAELVRVAQGIVRQAAELVHVRLGARVLGLGGTFPKITGFGAAFKDHPEYDMSGLVTTTGHAGTVYLILETVREILRTATFQEQQLRLGVIGAAGSIGWSSVVNVHEAYGAIPVLVNDFRGEKLAEMIAGYQHGQRINQAENVLDVLRGANVIISAVTRPIDLDVLDPGKELDLQSKVIIDDSEPKAFSRPQVEARGGYVLNVVGEAHGDFKGLRRDGLWTTGPADPYKFGEEAGLYAGASWGCDIERVVVSWAAAYREAVTAEVTPANVRNIGRLCREAGIGAARFQSFSTPVDIP